MNPTITPFQETSSNVDQNLSNNTNNSSLKIKKDSHLIRKPSTRPRSPANPKQQHRQPVIIYTHSPKTIHTTPSEFMALVQKLTGYNPKPEDNSSQSSSQTQILTNNKVPDQEIEPPRAANSVVGVEETETRVCGEVHQHEPPQQFHSSTGFMPPPPIMSMDQHANGYYNTLPNYNALNSLHVSDYMYSVQPTFGNDAFSQDPSLQVMPNANTDANARSSSLSSNFSSLDDFKFEYHHDI